jgi:hypothetical protein
VKAEVRATSGLEPGLDEKVADKVGEFDVDPTIAGCLAAYLVGGGSQVESVLRQRLSQLLGADDGAAGSPEVIDLIVRLVSANVHRALKEERDASHVDHVVTRQHAQAGFDDVKEHISAELASRELPPRAAATPDHQGEGGDPPPNTLTPRVAADVGKVLRRLEESDPGGAAELRSAWQARGELGIAELIRAPQPWFEAQSAPVWATAAQIAHRAGCHAEAESGFLRAADSSSVDDRVRQIVRAARAAEADGRPERADELLARARAIDSFHPSVAIAEARQEDEPRRVLEKLESIDPLDDPQRVEIEVLRSASYLALGDEEGAEGAIAAAREADSDDLSVHEQEASLALARAIRRLSSDAALDIEELTRAIQTFRDLREEMISLGKMPAAGRLAARACQGLLLLDEVDGAGALLEQVKANPPEYEDSSAAGELGEVAVGARRADLVGAFAPSDDEVHRLLRADAVVVSENLDQLDDAVATLRELLSSQNDAVKRRAALVMLNAASLDPSVEWDEEAARLVGEEKAWTTALFEAARAKATGDLEEAERLLRPHSGRSTVMRSLVDLAMAEAGESGDWSKSLRLSAELLRREGTDSRDRLRHGRLIALSGDTRRAVAEFLALARDPRLPRTPRRYAYRAAADILAAEQDHEELEAVASEWFGFAEEDSDAGWLQLYALHRRSLADRAFERWRANELEVKTEQQALLLAQITSLAAPAEEAIAMVADLSDRFGRTEHLEFSVASAFLRNRDADYGEVLGARIKETFESFPTRFPNSTLMRAFD